jgi:hypothetical protein
MSLARLFPTIGSLIIRKLGDTGGPPSDRVSQELDNLIAWAKDAPRCILRNFAVNGGNIGTGLDTLHSFSLPANSLATNGDYLSIWYAGGFAGNANTKRVVASIDSQIYQSDSLFDIRGGGWWLGIRIGRVSATSVRVTGPTLLGDFVANSTPAIQAGAGEIYRPRNIPLTVSNLNSNAVTLLVQGETSAASDNDVTQSTAIIELFQQ